MTYFDWDAAKPLPRSILRTTSPAIRPLRLAFWLLAAFVIGAMVLP